MLKTNKSVDHGQNMLGTTTVLDDHVTQCKQAIFKCHDIKGLVKPFLLLHHSANVKIAIHADCVVISKEKIMQKSCKFTWHSSLASHVDPRACLHFNHQL